MNTDTITDSSADEPTKTLCSLTEIGGFLRCAASWH